MSFISKKVAIWAVEKCHGVTKNLLKNGWLAEITWNKKYFLKQVIPIR